MNQLLPYETIVKASEGDPEAVAAVLSHYAGYMCRHLCGFGKQYDYHHGNPSHYCDPALFFKLYKIMQAQPLSLYCLFPAVSQ